MKRIIVVLLVGASISGYSQANDSPHAWIVTANGTSLIDIFSFPTFQVGAEKRISESFSLFGEAGYQLYNFPRADTVFLKPRGFKFSLEGRIYVSKLLKERWADGLYVGLQGFWRKNQYTSRVQYLTPQDSSTIKHDEFGVKKSVSGMNIMLDM